MNNIYKKLSVILMFLSMVMCFCVNYDEVYGDSFFGTLSPGGVGNGGGGGEGYSRRPLAHGYRISLVYADSGYRVENTHSVDYWSQNQTLSGNNPVGYQALTGGSGWNSVASNWYRKYLIYTGGNKQYSKLTKQEVASGKYKINSINKNYDSVDFFKNNKENNKMGVFDESVSNPNCNSYVHIWKPLTGGNKINYCQSHSGNYFANNAADSFSKKFFEKDPGSNDYNWDALNAYLKNCGYNKKNNARENVIDATNNDIVIQLEPVSAISIDGKSTVYVGSMAEIFVMWKGLYYNNNYSNYYSNYTDLNPIIYAKSAKGKNKLAGITLSDNGEGILTYENNYNNSALGVVLFNLSDYIRVDCPSQVKDAFKKYKNNKTEYNEAVKEACKSEGRKDCSHLYAENYDKYGIDPSKITSCEVPTCENTYNNYINKGKTSIDFINTFLTDSSPSSWNLSDSKSKVQKGTHIWGAQASSTFDTLKGKKVCGVYSCQQLLDTYGKTDKTAQKLDELFNKSGNTKYPLLKRDTYEALGIQPSCESLPDNCFPKTEGDCSSSGALVFRDYDSEKTSLAEHEECIRKGIAYYDDNQANLQPSKNERYTTIAGTGIFCSETVTFDLPKESDSIIKAGKIFQWGYNIETETNNGSANDVKTFGQMKIVQECYTAYDSKNPIKAGTNFNWEKNNGASANTIRTKINIQYTDPTGSYKINSAESLTPIFDNVTYGSNMDETGKIKSSTNKFTITANYKFDYNKDFTWYSDKSDHYEKKDATTKTKDNENAYVFIGYGLPTSFSTPDGTYKGKLKAVITDIGTDGRFNKFVKNILGQSNGFEYSCSFKIHNETFGTECCTKEGEIIPGAPAYCGACDGNGEEPKGIDVVFRTVDLMDSNTEGELNKAFPGMSGTGVTGSRMMGANWYKLTKDEIYDVLQSTVYNSEYNEPMYQITLDVSLIQNIREANRTMRKSGKDPYTNMEEETSSSLANKNNGYAGYRFYKKDDKEQTYAYSSFLYYLTNSCKASKGGNCLKVSTSNPCIKGAGVHVPGCNQQWWNNKKPNIVK